jgi:alpha-L-fucosidase
MPRIEKMLAAVLVTASLALLLGACETIAAGDEKSGDGRIEWWQDARFGLFIHWGPVSLKGTEIGWSRKGERRGRKGTGTIPVEEYDNLYKRFNPVEFDAREWIAMAKEAGMKYLVFTTKHHDGFSMFDTALSDYKITNSPFQRDVVAELAEACHEAGIKLGFYYSQPDWYHPDYRTENHAAYIEYLHGQVRELCTSYGQVDIIWFDGLGGKSEDWDSKNLIAMIRELQPHAIVNNRAGVPADFDTPEQRIGRFETERAWESCITIGDQWAWKPKDNVKPLAKCIEILVRCVGGGGNLLFNVGPMPTGAIEKRQADRLKEMGAWLERCGEAVYETRGGPFVPGPWGASTHRGKKVYVHILDWSTEPVILPPIGNKIVESSILTGGKVKVVQTDERIEISVPPSSRKEIDTIVVLELDGPASDIAPVRLTSGSLAAGKKAAASNVFHNQKAYGADKAFDDDPGTRWATNSGVKEAWLEVDLGSEETIASVYLSEEYDRVQAFELQRKDGDLWSAFFKGRKIGKELTVEFTPVTARKVRLLITAATEGPTIKEFRLFPPGK